MEFSIMLLLFILGAILGSFYNVVAYRITKGESIVSPPSHCPNCNHRLKYYELIPIISYILQRGKCLECKSKISIFYPISEILCGLLFVISYLSFGMSLELIIAITFISMLIIIILSDYYYMVIEDSVLIFFGILLLIEKLFIYDIKTVLVSLLWGILSFVMMYLLKLFGDFLFKKESLGGGDIKLMFIVGFIIGFDMSIITLFLSAFLALPISIFILHSKKDHAIPYGPFLALAAMIIYFTHLNLDMIFKFLTF